MERRVAEVAIGTAQFGLDYGVSNHAGQVAPEVAGQLLQIARARGVDMLDTAPAYGSAESALGTLGTDGFDIVSKLPAGCAPEATGQAVAASLDTLGRDRLYGYIAHDPADLLGPQGPDIWRGLTQARDAGQVGRIGASVYTPEEVTALLSRYPLDLVQLPLNAIDGRWQSAGTLDALADKGCEIHVRSVYLQGLLQMPSTPRALQPWAGFLQRWRDWCAETGQTPVAACLGHVLALPQVDRAVIGVTNAQELSQALAVAPAAYEIPDDLRTNDPVLLNPSRWPA